MTGPLSVSVRTKVFFPDEWKTKRENELQMPGILHSHWAFFFKCDWLFLTWCLKKTKQFCPPLYKTKKVEKKILLTIPRLREELKKKKNRNKPKSEKVKKKKLKKK
jgi:hypothetical protein